MTFTARRRLLGARLGLLALVLIALAPLASQLRAEPRDWSWLAELACHDGPVQTHAPALAVPKAFVLDACAYCSLLIHSPALGSLDWALFALAVQQATPPTLRWQAPPAPRLPTAQSRAPPLFAG
ncbi:DUF2946 family protein [Pseudomonas sp. GOM7]|uniref:DUF2946 family protein n=1 Tax=Pseudomonas sp. GOM7 TaxID=2998079 RepID=UPI00227AB459|nr:DUF2946 family protein [Pseudomonas sp. GOM7]WAJ38453.1 DUF2946 family protein [Pseudomonas sp. GOM7]